MNKRLRKKKRVGEFKELGFELHGELRSTSDAELGKFVIRLFDVVQARKLVFSGGAGRDGKLNGFVTRAEGGSTTEDDRAALTAFLGGDAALAWHEVGALRDAWYGWN